LLERATKLFLENNTLYVQTPLRVHLLDASTGEVKESLRNDVVATQLVDGRFYNSTSVRSAKTLREIKHLRSPSTRILDGGCDHFRLPYTFFEEQFYAAGQCGGVFALDLEHYQIQWEYRSEFLAATPTAVYHNRLYALFEDGEIHAINLETGQGEGMLRTTWDLGGGAYNGDLTSRSVVSNEDIVVVTFNERSVWAFCEMPCD
jgi:outer membrane protein assembly factor BamB